MLLLKFAITKNTKALTNNINSIPTMKNVYFLILFCCTGLLSQAQVVKSTYTTGTTWTVPFGVTSITVKVTGGAAGHGGSDCGAGCGNAAAGTVGSVTATYTVAAGNIIGIYPGGKGGDGQNSATNTGGGAAGVATYSGYNGGRGGNAGPAGSSGGGGGGGAASVLTINSTIRIVAGGAGGGGGMANAANSGKAGVNTNTPNATNFSGANGLTPSGDGGGSGAGGGGYYGGTSGTLYTVSTESAGNGGFRGNNYINGATSSTNGTAASTVEGSIEVSYTAAAGTASSNQTICPGTSPSNITLAAYAGTVQWQVSVDNSNWTDIAGATAATLTSSQTGVLTAARYYRARVSNIANSNVVTVNILPASVTASMPAGSGTSVSPYLVNTFAHLRWISENSSSWNKVFTQTATIDASNTNTACYNAGLGWSPIGNATTPFTGSYNGNGYTISNLFLNRSATSNLGLFGRSGGAIENLNLTAASITATSAPTSTNIAVLVGYNSGSVTGCSVSGSVAGGNQYSGGIAGESVGSITNSSSSANVSGSMYTGGIAGQSSGTISRVFSSGVINSPTFGGGIVGALNNGILNDSYSSAIVAGIQRLGGAVGSVSNGTVSNIYSYGAVGGAINSGGLIGEAIGVTTVTNSFWDTQASGKPTSGGGATGKTTAEMKNYNTFFTPAWDLQCETVNGTNNYWGINSSDNGGYPFLSWQGFSTQCPVWKGETSSTLNDASNWSNGFVPLPGMDIIMSPIAQNDLIIAQNWQSGNITFNNSGRKINIGNNDLTIGGVIAGANATNYIRTNGSGKVK
ncbi:MAG: hypothetical protein EOO04_02870, partial [Chitinophagaceae bacterium]